MSALHCLAITASAPAAAAVPDDFPFGSSQSELAPRATLTFDGITPFVALDTGWIQENGSHASDNPNYLTGVSDTVAYNSFFSFALGALAPASPYTSATLTISAGVSRGTGPFSLGLFDVDANLLALDADRGIGDAAGQALYADLGGGISYGSASVSRSTAIGDQIVIMLNQAFLDEVNAGLLSTFSIGGARIAATMPAVPEPASWATTIGGIGLAGGALRRRTRATVRFA